MRLGDAPESGNFEDRTGQSGGGGGLGGGLIGMILPLVASRFGIVGVLVLGLGYCALTSLGGGAAIKIMDSSLICNPKLVRHFRTIAEREGIPHQMEILSAGGTDAGSVQRQHGGIPAFTLSIPTRYVHTVNEMVSVADLQACIDLLARFLEEAHTGDYSL